MLEGVQGCVDRVCWREFKGVLIGCVGGYTILCYQGSITPDIFILFIFMCG